MLEFVDRVQDSVFHGQTGRGKTHLVIAVGRGGVEAGRSVRFFIMAALMLLLTKAKREGCLDRHLADIDRNNLMILDEFGYMPIDLEGATLLFQMISSYYERRSMMLAIRIEFRK